ncbi:hypothetical protein CPLU01_08248 [Colletotrichum plurivorum]|uniref:Uncharacterized protein n=1 Tax=Colletotrichum plurivorum TaxID=2175906 RepID=A0A8H6KCJ0_9PEZI|nr:hypothetical protein CPLU01_08248 [Colletotrichum plurivorum]
MDRTAKKRVRIPPSPPTKRIRTQAPNVVQPAQPAPGTEVPSLPYEIFLSIVDAFIADAEEKASRATVRWDVVMSTDAAGDMILDPSHVKLARARFDVVRSVSQVDQRSRRAVHRAFPMLPFRTQSTSTRIQDWNISHPSFVPFVFPKTDVFRFIGGLSPTLECRPRVGKPWPKPPGAVGDGPEGPPVLALIENCLLSNWLCYAGYPDAFLRPLHFRFLSQMPNLKALTVVDRIWHIWVGGPLGPTADEPHDHEGALDSTKASLGPDSEWMWLLEWQPLLNRGVKVICRRPTATFQWTPGPSRDFEVLDRGGNTVLREMDRLCPRCPRVTGVRTTACFWAGKEVKKQTLQLSVPQTCWSQPPCNDLKACGAITVWDEGRFVKSSCIQGSWIAKSLSSSGHAGTPPRVTI